MYEYNLYWHEMLSILLDSYVVIFNLKKAANR